MLIFSENITPRLEYVLDFIFRESFRTEYKLTGKSEEFESYTGPRINYSDRRVDGVLNITDRGLLSETSLSNLDPKLSIRDNLPILFTENDRNIPLGFDIFSAVFYMLSRYEEYLAFKPDEHGRFKASESLAGNNGFLETPVVDLWIRELRKELVKLYPGLELYTDEFRFLSTCDVDLPYAYLHRGALRTKAVGLKSGLAGGTDRQTRREVLAGQTRDPFDTFREIEALHALHGFRPIMFFLTSGYGRYDKSISPRSKVFKSLVRGSQKYADLGIHPSYKAATSRSILSREVRRLAGISGEEITRSRQHYLKFRIPGSYREYIKAGIQEEYSMGFASAVGFRAGSCRPFYFYDLEREKKTGLRVVPFQAMDRTLKDYMQLNPEQALEKMLELAGACREVGGTFCTIWHNDAFSDFGEWKGWKDVYLQLISTLSQW